MKQHQFERGQTVSFYIFAILLALALSLFVSNYTNTVRWHIRAQNAADEVALASLADEASLANDRTMALYTSEFAELRVRSVVISMMNAANSNLFANQSTDTSDTNICNDSLGADDSGYDCDNAYDQEPPFYDEAVSQYATAVGDLESLTSPPMPPVASPPPGYPTNQPSSPSNSTAGAAYSIAANGTSCQNGTVPGTQTSGAFDCAFWYNANLTDTGPGTIESVVVIACRRVSAMSPGFFKLFGSMFSSDSFQFNAIALSAATLVPVTETFDPGTETDPANSPDPYAPVEACPPTNLPAAFGTPGPCKPGPGWMSSPYYTFNASPLDITATFYVPEPTAPQDVPVTTPNPNCEQG